MNKGLYAILILFLAVATAPGAASAQITSLTGYWTNVKSNTRGIVALDITTDGTNVFVQTFGACQPHPCDWGKVQGYAYAPSSTSNLQNEAMAITVVYTVSLVGVTTLVIERSKGVKLVAKAFHHLTDSHNSATDFVSYNVLRRSQHP